MNGETIASIGKGLFILVGVDQCAWGVLDQNSMRRREEQGADGR